MRIPSSLLRVLALTALLASPLMAQQRPVTFLDVQEMRRAGSWAPSPDGTLMLYTVTVPDWEEAETQSDIHIVSMEDGVSSSRRLTYTDDKNESQPTWAPDGSFFVFASNRDDENQLYMMRHDGGEARKITDAEGGVSGFDFSPGGEWLVYRSGESGREQLYRLTTSDLFGAEPEKLTQGDAGVTRWEFSPDGGTVYFVRPDWYDEDDEARREAGFTVDIRNMETPLASLWAVDVAAAQERRLTEDASYSVGNISVSEDGRWIGFNGGSPERYERNITGARLYADLYLMEVATGHIERLTENFEVGESGLSFSPDGRFIAFSAPDDMERYSMTENRIYIREVNDRGGMFRKLGSDFDQSLSVGFWSDDAETIYFNAGVRVTTQLHAVDTESGEVTQLTDIEAGMSVNRAEDSGALLIGDTDRREPTGGRLGTGPHRGGELDQHRREDRGWDVHLPGGLSGRTALSAHGHHPRRAGLGGPPQLQQPQRPGVRRRRLCGAPSQLPGLPQLRQCTPYRHRGRLLHSGLRRHHDGRRLSHRRGHRRR
jgi:Tol biopolymer transport system component